MTAAPRSRLLLTRVGRRLQWRALLAAAYWSLVVVYGLFAVALLARRLTGVIPDVFTWTAFAAVPLIALVVGLLWHRRPALRETARVVDQASGVKDLYLTLSLLDSSAGEYQPLVVQSAEDVAQRIDAKAVVPFQVQRRYWQALWLPAAIACGMLFLPQLDPFGRVASASLVAQRKDRLAESRKQTELRLAEVKKQTDERDDLTPANEAVDHLQLALKKMEPAKQKENLRSLGDEQKQLGEEWRKLATDKLKNLLKSAPQSDQQFGLNDQEQLRKWAEEMQQGSADGLKQEMKEIKDKLQQLAKTKDPIEKQKLQKELKDRMKNLDKFAQQNLDAQALSAALQRAMKQMDLAQLDDLSSEALDAALESLDLSEMELEELAQSAEDLKKLEEALKTVQMAKRLNDFDKLDGRQCQNCKSMKDFQQMYKKMLAECQGQCKGEGECEGCAQCKGGKYAKRGSGSGMGGPGTGEGNIAPEDDSIQTEFQSETAKSAVQAGKILLSMKSKGLGERGHAVKDYRGLVQQVKQGVSEAILQEQVPPGYHQGIQSYFDALEPADATKP
jgi:hypothetical protein